MLKVKENRGGDACTIHFVVALKLHDGRLSLGVVVGGDGCRGDGSLQQVLQDVHITACMSNMNNTDNTDIKHRI